MILKISVLVLLPQGLLWVILMPSWEPMNKTEGAFLTVSRAWIFKI